MKVLLVRHAQAEISDKQPPGSWPLTEAGSESATALRRRLELRFGGQLTAFVASTERKAIETVALLTDSAPAVDERLREVSKPWYPDAADHEVDAVHYLRGISVPGWEPQHEAVERFGAAVAALHQELAAVASHGTVMSLWLAATLPDFDPVSFWLDLQFADAHLVHVGEEPTVNRI